MFGCSKPVSQTNAGEVILVGDIDFRQDVAIQPVDTLDDTKRSNIEYRLARSVF